VLRNAIAHSLHGTTEEFKTIVRGDMATFPPSGLPVGKYLSMVKKEGGRITNYFDRYVAIILFVSEKIIPN